MRRDKEYFTEWFTRTLAERDIAGGEVARALGVDDSAVSRWRNGKASPGLDSIMKLAAFFGVDPIRLAVTAGLMDAKKVGVERLPLPADNVRRNAVRERLKNVRGLTSKELEGILRTFEALQEDHELER